MIKIFLKFFKIILIFALMSSNCSAMNFSQTTELGTIATFPPDGHFIIDGATSLQGNDSKGIATFGSNENILYVYYDNSYFYSEDFAENAFHSKELAKSFKIGGNNIENTLTLPMAFPHTCKIYLVSNDSNIKMYLLEYDKSSVPTYKMIGKREDGKFVKYFETVAAEQYYGMKRAFCHNFLLRENSIVFEYGRYDIAEKKFITSTELRFIWNDSDQWFGVEQFLFN